MLGSPAATGPGGGGDRAATLWPPTPPASIYPPPAHHHHQNHHHTTVSSGITTSVGATPLTAPACITNGSNSSSTAAEAFSRYGLYSVFPGGAAAAAGAFYSHAAAATAGAFGRPPTAATYYAQHKLISETAGCYTFGAPTPPPGSPYSPLPVTHLELLAKSFNNNNIIIQQQSSQQQDLTTVNSHPNNIQQSHIATISNTNNLINHNNNNIINPPTIKDKRIIDEQQLKRWMNTSTLPLSVKTENHFNTTVKPPRSGGQCGCRNSNSPSIKNNNKFENNGGCSRTNPWTPNTSCNALGQHCTANSGSIGPIHVQVKREPATTPACQVAEITTSNNTIAATIVKVEAASPTSSVKYTSSSPAENTSSIVQTTMSSITTCTTGNGTIPVGIAVARQRLQQELQPQLQPAGGLLTTAPAQIKEIDSASVAAAAAMTVGVTTNGAGGSLVQCADDRTNNIQSWPIPPAHGSTLAAPTLWQYPAPVPMEPMLPVPVPMPPVGFQLVRDPTTGHFFVIPTTSFDQLQQAVVWPSYPQPSSHVLLPPIPPPPLAPLQLLGSTTSDYLTTASTTLHQHTQTHSTRLVALTTDNNKRKIPLPSHTLIKIESDCAPPEQTTKTLQTVSTMATNNGAMFADQSITPLLTTHVFYQHPTNLIQISQPTMATEAVCRSQATSPVACLTPPPESSIHPDVEDSLCPGVQDASNQTDTPICSEDDNTIHNIPDNRDNYYYPMDKIPEELTNSTHKTDSLPAPQMSDLKIPIIVPPTSVISPPATMNDVKIQISSAITTQLSEVRPCMPITIMSQIEPLPPKPSAKIVEIVEPESSTKEVDSTTANEEGEEVVSTTTNTYTNVDISGLELLSNSIVELENYRKSFDATPVKIEKDTDDVNDDYQSTGEDVVKKIADMSITDSVKNKKDDDTNEVCEQNDDLGGLGLLCALAEQRIMEEVTEKSKCEVQTPPTVIKFEKHMDIDCKKKLKRCLEERYSLEGHNKKFKVGDFEFERKPVIKQTESEKIVSENETTMLTDKSGDINGFKENEKNSMDCDKTASEQEESIKDTGSDMQPCCNKSEWSKMNELEKDMRLRLAELQRQCNEKQMELKNLTPKVDTESKKPLRKSKSKSLDCDRRSLSPPKLEKEQPILGRLVKNVDLLKPPVLNTTRDYGHIKTNSDNVFSDMDNHKESHKRKLSPALSEVLSDSTPFEKCSSSKKRKVGRPKKLSTPDLCEATEMIVAKKPKSLVGYLLAAKSRLHSQSKSCSNSSSPPRYNIEDSPSPKPKSKSHKKRSTSKSEKKKKSLNKKRDKHDGSSKVRPKLKAEAKVKLFSDEDENSSSEWSHQDNSSKLEDYDDDTTTENIKDDEEVDNDEVDNDKNDLDEPETETRDMRCVLTAEHLEIDKLRVLTSMGGLFYAGVLSAIQAPDIYAITLDGERGNRPHIMSREEILRDAILEVSPETTQELVPGTRMCAYWSQQYRCLYPGTVAEPGSPDPTLDDKFVPVEFDDGDSGRIALEDIRLLQPDYPIVEYDPNPLLSLSKRKRRTSMNGSVEERRLSVQSTNIPNMANKILAELKPKMEIQDDDSMTDKHHYEKEHKERKKLKKHRRDKLKDGEEKKRKRKHKCNDENCKHRRHHKKHRKHKKHHHSSRDKTDSSSSAPDTVLVEDDAEASRNMIVEKPVAAIENHVQDEQSEEEKSVQEENVVSEPESEQDEDENEEDSDVETKRARKKSRKRERQESVESRSKMAAFLPARQLWGWAGKGYKRPGAKGRARKQFYKQIQRGKEIISVGDAAVFLSTGRPDRPYIGRIQAMWESLRNSMVVKVKWFYHPEETATPPQNFLYPGALFESPHVDENDVQTISHKCEVLPLKEYTERLGPYPQGYTTIYDNNDIYYRAGYYDPTTAHLSAEDDIPTKPE